MSQLIFGGNGEVHPKEGPVRAEESKTGLRELCSKHKQEEGYEKDI